LATSGGEEITEEEGGKNLKTRVTLSLLERGWKYRKDPGALEIKR